MIAALVRHLLEFKKGEDADRNDTISIFGIAKINGKRPLSRVLQIMDFCKALNLLDAALVQLQELRNNPQKIIDTVESDFDSIEWEEKRVPRRTRMPGELPFHEPATSAKDKWFRDALQSIL